MYHWTLILALALTTLPVSASFLENLDAPIEGRRMRASSHNLLGENRDHAAIDPGQTITLAELDGPGVIQHIWFTVSTGDYRYPAKTILRMYWDDAEEPSVQAPLGDFFAAGNGMRVNVNSEAVQVSAEGRSYNCYWRMPFRKKARITMENQSDRRMTALYYYIDWMKLPRPRAKQLYFHAQYRQARPHLPPDNYVILDTTGAGHYVGTVLSSHNGYHAWFGEGDDLVYIDGESEPSLTGTGTEDYFNDAWGFRVFNHPYAGCTIFEGRSIDSRVTAYRWHLPDPIPYRKSLRFTIENKGWVSYESGRNFSSFFDRRDNYSSVAFFYQERPATGVPPMPPLEERVDPELYLDSRALETAGILSAGATASLTFSRRIPGRRFYHLRSTRPETELTIPIRIAERGRYSLSIWQVGTPDGGIYQAALNDTEIRPYVDFYDPAEWIEEGGRMLLLRPMTERKLGLFYLEPGEHRLVFTCVGRHPASMTSETLRPAYGLGLNALSLRKIAFENMDQYLE